MEIATAHVDVEELESRASELAAAITRGERTIYTAMLREELRAVEAAIKSAWNLAYIKEYIRDSGFAPYMGKKYDLQPDADGKTTNIPLITRIQEGDPSQVLDGTEEDLSVYNCALSIDWRRSGGTPH